MASSAARRPRLRTRGLNRRAWPTAVARSGPTAGCPVPAAACPTWVGGSTYTAEADERILGGCGLMGVCDESGARMSGELALRSMASMHDRGNGLGGGFAGYGIYPELPHAFCFHLLYTDEVGQGGHRVLPGPSTSVIVHRRAHPHQADPGHRGRAHPLALLPRDRRRAPGRDPADRRGLRGARGHGHQHPHRRRLRRLVGQEHGRLQGRRLPGGDRGVLPPGRVPGLDLDRPRPLPHQHPRLVGRGASLRPAGLLHRAQRRDQLLRHQPALPGDVRLPVHAAAPTPRWSPTCSTCCSAGTGCPWRSPARPWPAPSGRTSTSCPEEQRRLLHGSAHGLRPGAAQRPLRRGPGHGRRHGRPERPHQAAAAGGRPQRQTSSTWPARSRPSARSARSRSRAGCRGRASR